MLFCVPAAWWKSPFQLSFRSKPGAVLHQRNNKKLTACTSYSECKITFRVLTPPFVFPSLRPNSVVRHNARPPRWSPPPRLGEACAYRWREGYFGPGCIKDWAEKQHNRPSVWSNVCGLCINSHCLLSPDMFSISAFCFPLRDILTLAKICGRSVTAGRPCMLIGGGPR